MGWHQLELPLLVGCVQKLRNVEEITQTLYLVLQYLSLGSGDGRGYSLLKKGDAQGVADRPVLCHSPPCPAGLCLSPREGQSTTKGSGGVSCLHCMTVIL